MTITNLHPATRRCLQLLALIALVLTTSASACANGQSSDAYDEAPPQGDTIQIMSPSMNRSITNLVIVPEQYFDPDLQDEQYPVIYLLHGYDGTYDSWAEEADLDDLASEYGVIIVCPDGQDSWYFDSPIDPTMQFETYVSSELVNYIDNHYRTFDNRYMRAICGLSMGGHGALFLAWRHPDVFWSCSSMSGNMDITEFPDKWKIKDRLGPYADNKQRWHDLAVCNLIDLLTTSTLKPELNILIDDGVDDIFINNNNSLHAALLQRKIAHDYVLRPGRHTWTYWVNALDYHVLFFSKAFERASQYVNPDTTATANP